MPHRQQLNADLEAVTARITEGEGYLQRMEGLVQRMREKGEDPAEQLGVLAEMSATMASFQERRAQILKALDAGGLPLGL